MQAWRRRLLGVDAVPADLSEAEIRHFFTLEKEQASIVAHRRRDMNRFGLAIQIGFLCLAGRPLDPMRLIPPAVLACVAEQTGVAAPMIATLRAIYRRRRRTLFEHQQAAIQALGFRPCTPAAERALTAHLRKEARSVMDRGELVTQARAWLYDHGYVAPGKRRLDDLASAAQNFVFAALQSAIVDRVGKEAAASWVAELTGPGRMAGETRLDWLRRPAGGTSVRDISDVQARLDELRRLGAEHLDLPALPIERMRTHARRIALRKASTLNRLREPRRTVEIGCWLRLQLITLTDTVLEQTNRHVGDLWGRARQRVENRALNELQRYRVGMDAVCAALAEPNLPPDAFRSAVAEAAAPFVGVPPRDSKAHAIRTEMAGEPGRLRALMRRVTGLDLSIDDQHPLRIALSTLMTAYKTGDPRIPAAAVQALPRAARRPVERAPSPSDRLSAFEVAAALLLKRSLRNGQASAPHSLKHRAVADQLMPRSMWAEQRGRILRANGWPSSLDAYLRRFERPLALRLEMLDEAVEAGEIGIERDRFKVPRYRPDPVDPEVDRTRDALFAAIGEVQLPDILVATDVRARFSWLALGRQPANERELLSHYAGLLALGTEKTAAAMARMVDGVSTDQIELAMRQIEEAGQLRAASDAVVADLLAQPIADLWGSGILASADMMSLDATRHLTIDRPNHVWCADITYIPMRRGFLYLVAIMDWASRRVLAWRLSNTMDAEFCIQALEEAMARFGVPEIFNTDQGSQFTSPRFTDVLTDAGVRISMDGRGRWMDNVFIERLWRSMKYECVYLHAFETGSELRVGLTRWIGYYNAERPHSGLGGRTPDEAYHMIEPTPLPGLAPATASSRLAA